MQQEGDERSWWWSVQESETWKEISTYDHELLLAIKSNAYINMCAPPVGFDCYERAAHAELLLTYFYLYASVASPRPSTCFRLDDGLMDPSASRFARDPANDP
jgi:hypothetical protein